MGLLEMTIEFNVLELLAVMMGSPLLAGLWLGAGTTADDQTLWRPRALGTFLGTYVVSAILGFALAMQVPRGDLELLGVGIFYLVGLLTMPLAGFLGRFFVLWRREKRTRAAPA